LGGGAGAGAAAVDSRVAEIPAAIASVRPDAAAMKSRGTCGF
jgi:hypothetical protein